jgi:hypothetical protein
MDWRHSSRGRALGLQAPNLKFKPQFHQKTKNFNMSFEEINYIQIIAKQMFGKFSGGTRARNSKRILTAMFST